MPDKSRNSKTASLNLTLSRPTGDGTAGPVFLSAPRFRQEADEIPVRYQPHIDLRHLLRLLHRAIPGKLSMRLCPRLFLRAPPKHRTVSIVLDARDLGR